MNKFLLTYGIVAILAGCAGNNPEKHYFVLRQSSLSVVAVYSESVEAELMNASPEQVINMAKNVMADTLKDPVSAQFRNIRLVQYLNGAVICGQMNGKNSYGGYVGFRDFVAGTKSGRIRSDDVYSTTITVATNAGIDTACSGKSYVQPERT